MFEASVFVACDVCTSGCFTNDQSMVGLFSSSNELEILFCCSCCCCCTIETLVSIAVDVDAIVSLMPHIRVFGEIGIGLEGE